MNSLQECVKNSTLFTSLLVTYLIIILPTHDRISRPHPASKQAGIEKPIKRQGRRVNSV